jgi:hypothetical protein
MHVPLYRNDVRVAANGQAYALRYDAVLGTSPSGSGAGQSRDTRALATLPSSLFFDPGKYKERLCRVFGPAPCNHALD